MPYSSLSLPLSSTSMSVVHFGDRGIPWWLSGRESVCQCRRQGFDPWVGKILSEVRGNGSSLQYLCLENPMDRGAWKAAAHGSAKSWMHKKTCTIWWLMPAYAGAGLVVDWCWSNTHVNPCSHSLVKYTFLWLIMLPSRTPAWSHFS